MTTSHEATCPRIAASPLVRALDELGMVLLPVDESKCVPTEYESAFGRMLSRSTMVQQAVRLLHARWAESRSLEPVDACPGVKLYPMTVVPRRRQMLQAALAVPTTCLRDAGYHHALFQSARMDATLGASLLEAAHLIAPEECDRLVSLVRLLFESVQREASGAEELEKMSRELAESYEELDLLYSTIRNMTVIEQPDRFVSMLAEELHGTLCFQWIVVILVDDVDHLKRLAGRSFIAGDSSHFSEVRAFARALVPHIDPGAPLVLDRDRRGPIDVPDVLGDGVLVQPICGSEGELLGLFVAGQKQGGDERISSADIKLMAATAGHAAVFLENAALYDDLSATVLGTLEALTASIDAKDPYTSGHSHRVAHLTRQLAAAIDLPDSEISKAHIAGLVHDVGKIGVPESVLTKPGRLTEEEFAWIRRHPEMGHRILRDIPQFRDMLPGVLHHHERWDGRGYPHSLAGESIPFIARMICLADSFDAMSSSRTYRAGLSRREVIEEIRRCAGTQFDPELVERFLAMDFAEFDRMIEEHRSRLPGKGEAAA